MSVVDETAHYICNSCGETIQIVVDISAGSEQEYVEDCPVCCHPNVIAVSISADGDVQVTSRSE